MLVGVSPLRKASQWGPRARIESPSSSISPPVRPSPRALSPEPPPPGAAMLAARGRRAAGLLGLRAFSTAADKDLQFWQKSSVPTMHFQKSLPRLPVPKLEDTVSRYLLAQKALLEAGAHERTARLAADFASGQGRELHGRLLATDRANKHTNYISDDWFEMYLRDRRPLPLNSNPFLVFNDEGRKELRGQVVRAANLVVSSVRFLRSLRSGLLEPEVFHMDSRKSDTALFRRLCRLAPSPLAWYVAYLMNAYPLDMSQYHRLFNSSRVPRRGQDDLLQDEARRHAVVLCNGHFFAVDVLDEAGDIVEPAVIAGSLERVASLARSADSGPGLGALTAIDRDAWAEARAHLEQTGNAEALRTIDTAVLLVALDDTVAGADLMKMARNFLLGPGHNRWFDKSFTLIVAKDGLAGVNFEHAWGDGVAVLRYFQDVLKDSTASPRVHTGTPLRPAEVRKIEFRLDAKAQEYIDGAVESYRRLCDSVNINYILMDGFGKSTCKKQSLSPDAVMQLGFQVAFHKQYGQFVATYESCSTAAFKRGRTETIRPLTVHTRAFAEAINSASKPSKSDLVAMIKRCSEAHSNLTKCAAMGQGFDRHLFALRRIAEKLGQQQHGLFTDEAYSLMNYNILSTSTLSSPAVQAGGFGPVVPDGYGIGYSIRDDSLGTLVTSYPPHRDGQEFVNCLKQSYQEIKDVIS